MTKFRSDEQRKAIFANMFKQPGKNSAVKRFGETKNLNVERKKGKNIVKSKRTTKNVKRIEGGLKNYSKAMGINIGLGVLFESSTYTQLEPSVFSATIPPKSKDDDFVFFDNPVSIEMISTTDEYTNLKPGAKGKAIGWNKSPDNVWVLLIDWEKGGNMGLVHGVDKWKRVVKSKEPETQSVTFSRKVRRTGRFPFRRKYVFEDLKTDVSPISGRKLKKAGPLNLKKKITATRNKISATSKKISKVRSELNDVRHELRVAKTKKQVEKAKKKRAKVERELKHVRELQEEKMNLVEEERKLKKINTAMGKRPKFKLPGLPGLRRNRL